MKSNKIFTLVCILILVLSSSCGSVRENDNRADVYPFVLYPVEKLRPADIPIPCLQATIRPAINEYEPVMFGLRNNSNREVRIDRLLVRTGSGCAFTCDLYRVSYYHVHKRSRWFDNPDKQGRWPDPLIPLIPHPLPLDGSETEGKRQDYDVQEFVPVPDIIVPPGENRLFLLDVYMPPDAQNKTGTIGLSLLLRNGEAFSTTIVVEPRKFSLPSQPTLITSVKCRIRDIIRLHKKKSYLPFNEVSLFYEYYTLLSKFRLFLYISDDPVIRKEFARTESGRDWSGFDTFFGPMLDGTISNHERKSPVYYFPELYGKTEGKDSLSGFFTQFSHHLKERGWLEKSVYYLADEPLYTDYPEIRKRAEFIKKHAPGLRIMVTDPYSESLEEVVDIWCVDMPFIGDSLPFLPGFMKNNHPVPEFQLHYRPSTYEQRSAMGEEFWIYTCTSARILDYPNLFIDSSGLHHRILPWLIFKYKGKGFYYWNATFSYMRNPWENQYYHGANGDGTLVYPCLPGMYGFSNHRPFPSLRIIMLREGLEDYEYLSLAARISDREHIQHLCNTLAASTLFWEHDVKVLQKTRDAIAAIIETSGNIK